MCIVKKSVAAVSAVVWVVCQGICPQRFVYPMDELNSFVECAPPGILISIYVEEVFT